MTNQVCWKDSEGVLHPIDQMGDRHVVNTVQMLFRRLGMDLRKCPEDMDSLRNWLEEYVIKHRTPKKKKKVPKGIKSFMALVYAAHAVDEEPWDEYEGSWEDCH